MTTKRKGRLQVRENERLMAAVPLQVLREQPGALSREDRLLIVEQALAMLEQSYIHLPQKRAMYAVDPIQRLRLLKYRIEQTARANLQNELLFHNEMFEIFTQVRDLHTNYLLPAPYNDQIAYLPFLIERYFDEDDSHTPHFIITWIDPGTQTDPHFVREVEVLYWNGVPIQRAIELNAARQGGSNPDARFERGLAAMTIRPLLRTLPPDEEWVRLRYRGLNGADYESEFMWTLYDQPSDQSAERVARGTGESLAFGFDIQSTRTQEARKDLMAPRAAAIAALPEGERLNYTSAPDALPTTLATFFRAQPTSDGRFGYIRIFTFMHPNADEFVAEFQRLIQALPQEGLIIDVRGNGGGNILACERLLQLLTASEIEPARFQFINSPLTLALCRRYSDLQDWAPSIAQSVETGTIQSLSFPVTSQESCNAIGQVYHGRVVLITDALCYSATDIFSAGFQDHQIGKILGTSGNTGAGGANVWTHSDLVALTSRLSQTSPVRDLLTPLPSGTEMRVAIRRCLRVGVNAGIPVEDLGIVPDARHFMTRRDLLEHNHDLLDRAASLLTAHA